MSSFDSNHLYQAENEAKINKIKKLKLNNISNLSVDSPPVTQNDHPSSYKRIKLRFLIFVEDSTGCRSNIFDSSSELHQNNTSNNNLNNLNPSSSTKAKFKETPCSKLNNEMITRMVFGSFPMVVSNRSAIKVHNLKSSRMIMISNVFTYYNTNFIKPSLRCRCSEISNASESETNSLYSMDAMILGSKKNSIDRGTIIGANSSYNEASSNRGIPILFNNASNKLQLFKNSSSSINDNTGSVLCDHPMAFSLNTSSFYMPNNEDKNTNTTNTLGSSVPNQYGGIFKRLMRSLSNSLNSSTNTIINTNRLNTNTNNNSNISNLNSSYNLSDRSKDDIAVENVTSASLNSKNSFNLDSAHPNICEKCVEKNCYPKYKIGVCVIYCFPSLNNQKQTASTPTSKVSPSSFSLLLSNSSAKHPDSPCQFNSNPSQKVDCSKSIENYQEFFFSHLPIIEYQFKEFKEKAINYLHLHFSYSNISKYASSHPSNLKSAYQKNFNQQILFELEDYEKRFNLLYFSPRLNWPVWLTLINSKKLGIQQQQQQSQQHKTDLFNDSLILNSASPSISPTQSMDFTQTKINLKQICDDLINNFVFFSDKFKKKLTTVEKNKSIKINFLKSFSFRQENNQIDYENSSGLFLSKLLSTILKYHLSWVATVLPSNEFISKFKSENDKKTPNLRKKCADWTSILEKTNPYNPLWAQLGDLHGAIYHPFRLVRTVIVGNDKELVERLIGFLSYFIRCGNSSYFDVVQEKFDFEHLASCLEMERKHSYFKVDNFIKNDLNEEKLKGFIRNTSGIRIENKKDNNHIDDDKKKSSLITIKRNETDDKNEFITNENAPILIENISSIYKSEPVQSYDAQELPLIGCQLKPNYLKSTRMQDNFGYSLMASYCEQFVFEFVLHGTSDRSFLNDLNQMLMFSKKNSILDCSIDESIYIVIDIDQWDIEVHSSNVIGPVKEKSIGLVDSLVQSVLNMIKLFQNSEFVLYHLEDKLQEFYTKAMTLKQLKSQSNNLDDSVLIKLLNINDTDDLVFLKQILSAVSLADFV